MKLQFQLLENMIDYNQFYPVEEFFWTQGDAGNLFFQLVSAAPCREVLRYIPTTTAEIIVKFLNLDTNKEITRAAVMVYPGEDRSIWSVPVQASDVIAPDSMRITLTEGGVTRNLTLIGTLRTTPTGFNQFFC